MACFDFRKRASALKAKLAAYDAVNWLVGSQAARAFFEVIMPGGIGFKSVQHLLGVITPKRVLKVEGDKASYDVVVRSRVTRAVQFVQVLVDDAYVFGYKRGFTEVELDEQVCRYFVLDWCGVAIKQVKTHLVWLSGFGRNVNAPTEGLLDMKGLLLTPHYREWCKQRLRSSSGNSFVRDTISETYLLGTKRGFPSEEDDMVKMAGDSYATQMSQDLPRDRGAVLVWKGTKFMVDSLVQNAIEETVEEVFGHTLSVPWRAYTPSQRAGYKAPIARGGILGELLRRGVTTTMEVLVSMLENRGEIYEVRGYEVDTVSVYRHALEKWGVISQQCIADCQVYFIREPLKLRTITAGTPELYGALAPILGHLRDGMRKFNCFQLTRKECDWQVVEDRLNQNPLGRDSVRLGTVAWDWFISGDYQQSTNDLAMWATEIAVSAAFSGEAWHIANKALGRQLIHLDKDRKFVQNRGQLMGSPLSFPFLCVINAALARLAYQVVHPELEGLGLDRFPFLVNGDDFLARASEDVEWVWRRLIGHVGWKLSPGKSYFLQRLVQINSQTRHVIRLVENDGRPSQGKDVMFKVSEPIAFVNGGYLQQMKKTTSQIDSATIETMSVDWTSRWKALERLPGTFVDRAREVMERNLLHLSKELFEGGRTPFALNLYNPVGLGGLGLTQRRKKQMTVEPLGGKAVEFQVETNTLDMELAWRGLHAGPVRSTSVRLKYDEEKYSELHARELEPLLEWRGGCPAAFSPSRLLDALVDDLDRYVELLLGPRVQPKAGILDLVVRQSTTLARFDASQEVKKQLTLGQ